MFNTCSCALTLNASLINTFSVKIIFVLQIFVPDIDECAGEHSCAYGCKNTDGGYDCLCENGSEIASAGHECQGQREEKNNNDYQLANTSKSALLSSLLM